MKEIVVLNNRNQNLESVSTGVDIKWQQVEL